jgi:hypothetical protein
MQRSAANRLRSEKRLTFFFMNKWTKTSKFDSCNQAKGLSKAAKCSSYACGRSKKSEMNPTMDVEGGQSFAMHSTKKQGKHVLDVQVQKGQRERGGERAVAVNLKPTEAVQQIFRY